MIRFQCPLCNTVVSAPDADAGRKGDCPKCGQRLQVPPAPLPVQRLIDLALGGQFENDVLALPGI
jgi:uncharacterized paraquat-inducible protein A